MLPKAVKSRGLSGMEDMLGQVRTKLAKLGLNLFVWDESLEPVSRCEPVGDFCSTICTGCKTCREALSRLAGSIIEKGSPGTGRTELGCAVVGVPVFRRRRLVGAAVACFPVREILDEEHLARVCDRFKLDRQVVETYARRYCHYSLNQVDDFCSMLQWLLTQEQDVQTAREELVTLSDNLSSTYEELSLVYRISGSMRVTQSPREFLSNICEDLQAVLNLPIAAVSYAKDGSAEDDIVVVVGSDISADCIKGLADRVIEPRLAQANGPVVDNKPDPVRLGDDRDFIRNYIAVPLSTESDDDNSRISMLVGFNKDGDFDTVDLKLLSSIGNQGAVFLANSRLYADLQELLMGVLHALTATIDAKDPYTCGHSQRVAMLSRKLAEKCGYSPAKVQRIYLAGLLHDIGKIGIPESILCKPGLLTNEEYDVVKSHPSVGATILGGIRQLEDVIPAIIAHHERPDGGGYPQGLKGREVPKDGMIIGLADCFDAMTSDRTYRKALPLASVIREIRDHAGVQFDAELAEKFLSLDLEGFMREMRGPARTVFPVSDRQEQAK